MLSQWKGLNVSDDRSGFGSSSLGSWMGDYQDLVHRSEEGAGEDEGKVVPLEIRKRWNPVTYRCRFCGASFKSRAMIRRHLERHAEQQAAAGDEQVQEQRAA